MAGALLRTRNGSDSRDTRGHAVASNNLRRPHCVRRTDSSRLSLRGIAEKQKELLAKYTEGEIAVVADCSKDTAQSWKLGRRTANTAYMLAMARTIDEIGLMIAEEADLGRFYGHDERIKKILQDIALREDQQGAFARSILREIGMDS